MRTDAHFATLTTAFALVLTMLAPASHANPPAADYGIQRAQGAPELILRHSDLPFSSAHVPLGWTAHPPHRIVPVRTTPSVIGPDTVITSLLTPVQLRTAYGMTSLPSSVSNTTGAGITVAIVDAYGDIDSSDVSLIQSDLQKFCTTYSLPYSAPGTSNPTLVESFPEGHPTGYDASWAVETALDVEWVHAVAPGASILLISVPSASDALYSGVTDALNAGADIVSMSWGGDEFQGQTYFDSYFPGNSNASYVVATGDVGGVLSYPSTSPNVTAIGGTNLNVNSSTYAWVSETGWDDGGGGVSAYEGPAAFQSSWITSGNREVPDVAAMGGNPGVIVIQNGTNHGVEGTSLATPLWAGFLAVVDGNLTTPISQSTLSQAIYTVGNQSNYTSFFHDVTSTLYDDGGSGFQAATGYDLATGIGTPKANVFIPAIVQYVNNYAAPVLTSLSPSTVLANGSAQTLTVTGSGFVSGAVIQVGGTAKTTTFVNSTTLTCSVSFSTAQTVPVTVLNPQPTAGASSPLTLTATAAVTNVLLNHAPDNQFSIWWISGSTPTTQAYGPFSGWKAIAFATGNDNVVHLLLDHTADHQFSLWAINLDGSYTYTGYAASTGWAPVDIGVTADNHVHVLTTHTADNQFRLYDFTTPSSYTTVAYGPYSGWQGTRIAGGGSDNHLHVLLDHTADHQFSLWDVTSPTSFTSPAYGPFSGWQAKSIAVTSTNHLSLLLNHAADGQFSIWDMTSATSYTHPSYGPFSGWTATGVGDTSDAHVHLGLVGTTGAFSLWNMTSPTSYTNPTYGPYSGWSEVEVSGH